MPSKEITALYKAFTSLSAINYRQHVVRKEDLERYMKDAPEGMPRREIGWSRVLMPPPSPPSIPGRTSQAGLAYLSSLASENGMTALGPEHPQNNTFYISLAGIQSLFLKEGDPHPPQGESDSLENALTSAAIDSCVSRWLIKQCLSDARQELYLTHLKMSATRRSA